MPTDDNRSAGRRPLEVGGVVIPGKPVAPTGTNAARTIRIERYYSSLDRLKELYDRHGRKMPLRAGNEAEFGQWRSDARAALRDLLGLDRMESCALEPKLLLTEEVPEGRREKWILQTEPGVWMPLYALVPRHPRCAPRCPAVIAPHGHDGGGKLAVAGRDDIPAVRDAIARYSYDYGRRLCAAG
ncbi:MAG: hypothetical protein FJ399_06305, partial [Verrucomicrobia bacterium]|nr:hypothetical protein [Verrucomicrobiota bacterium]